MLPFQARNLVEEMPPLDSIRGFWIPDGHTLQILELCSFSNNADYYSDFMYLPSAGLGLQYGQHSNEIFDTTQHSYSTDNSSATRALKCIADEKIHLPRTHEPPMALAARASNQSHGTNCIPTVPSPASLRRRQSRRGKEKPTNLSSHDRMTEEEKYLLHLYNENLTWKDITKCFETRLGKTYRVPALQMRLTRLRKRFRVRTKEDADASRPTYKHRASWKFDIISSEMPQFGGTYEWNSRNCSSNIAHGYDRLRIEGGNKDTLLNSVNTYHLPSSLSASAKPIH